MNILAIDTTSKVMGLAILKNDIIIGEIVTNISRGQSERLMPAIVKLMEEVELVPEQLDKIIVAQGPGSYTGVRIGVTTAKSLAWALNIPIVGVSSLEVLAYQGRLFSENICSFFDARRSNIYTNVYHLKGNKLVANTKDIHTSMESLLNKLIKRQQKTLFLSPDIALYKDEIIDVFGDLAVIPEMPYHFSRPSHLGLIGKKREADDLHSLTPNYIRLAEAESNWLKQQKEQN